jgi:hypothetical protein
MFIYLGKYFHRAGKELNLSEKKIGKTINLDQREHELGRTNSPIGYTYINAWKTGEDTDKVERQIHSLLEHERMKNTEWFEDTDDSLNFRIGKFMRYGGYVEVELGRDDDADVNIVRKEAKDKTVEVSLREKIQEWLDGETFTITRPKFNSTLNVTIRKDGFYCKEDDTLYDSLHKSFTQPLLELVKDNFTKEQIVSGASINAWTACKDTNGHSIMDRLRQVDQSRKDVKLKNE